MSFYTFYPACSVLNKVLTTALYHDINISPSPENTSLNASQNTLAFLRPHYSGIIVILQPITYLDSSSCNLTFDEPLSSLAVILINL